MPQVTQPAAAAQLEPTQREKVILELINATFRILKARVSGLEVCYKENEHEFLYKKIKELNSLIFTFLDQINYFSKSINFSTFS